MRLGVDVGGTAIKSGLVDDEGRVFSAETVPTNASRGSDAVLESLTTACLRQLHREKVSSVGIGMPGRIDPQKGIFVRAANLPLQNLPLAELLSGRLGLPVFLENDANCALMGEIFAGAGKKAENFLLVTVGTGIGGGIRAGGRIYKGLEDRAGEFGHMIVSVDGRPCPCGRVGCWEQYASASALCRMTEEAAQVNEDSLLARQIRQGDGVIDGRTAFSAAEGGCPIADGVLEEYARYLAVGLTNLMTIFRPERIVLAGGIFKEGDALLSRIQRHCIEPELLSLSTLDGRAGLIGASLLEGLHDEGSPLFGTLQTIF